MRNRKNPAAVRKKRHRDDDDNNNNSDGSYRRRRRVCLPVCVGDQRQATIVPRNFPQNRKDKEQHLKKRDEDVLLDECGCCGNRSHGGHMLVNVDIPPTVMLQY